MSRRPDVPEEALVAHVLRRTGFGPHPGQVDEWVARGGADAVIAAAIEDTDTAAVPELSFAFDDDKQYETIEQAVQWIISAQQDPAASLHEKMVWFWHDHFATSIDKVDFGRAMWEQHLLLRQHALGNFRDMCQAITVDRAMLIYLDGDGSTADAPNENYARELMELFTLGPGNYTEDDIRAGAKALAGYWLNYDNELSLEFDEDSAYQGTLTFLGQRGQFRAPEIVDIVCDQPACPEFIAAKLHKYLVGVDPSPERRRELARVFRDSNLEIRPLVAEILTDPSFLETRMSRPRYPVEWLAAARAVVGLPEEPTIWRYEEMGQVPWRPPNVAGWPPGNRWLAADQMLHKLSILQWTDTDPSMVDPEDPVGSILRRCSLWEVSQTTRDAIQKSIDTALETGDDWYAALALITAVASPEFSLA